MTRSRGITFLLFGVEVLLLALLPEVHAEHRPHRGKASLGPEVLSLRAPLPDRVLVPAGRFRMGSTADEAQAAFFHCRREPLGGRCHPDAYGDELPTRVIELAQYVIMRHEVTVRDYTRCVAARRCKPPPYFRGSLRFRRDAYPVSLVTWQDARAYCAFIGGRLPTEAEFERAARGTTSRTYPWGNLYNAHVSNHGKLASDRTSDVDGYRELAPVGSFPNGATKLGVLDLAGNVAEWVFDRYAVEYDPRDTVNPRGPRTSAASRLRVVRGGGYDSASPELRGADRTGALASERRPSLGFRCVDASAIWE